jgi:hypothetical protein
MAGLLLPMSGKGKYFGKLPSGVPAAAGRLFFIIPNYLGALRGGDFHR